jgi:LCP family protein required for cell wall assembly
MSSDPEDLQPPIEEPEAPEAPEAPVPPEAVPEEVRLPGPRWALWVAGVALVLVAYGVLAVGTAIQPIPLPLRSQGLTLPIPGLSTARLFALPDDPFTVLIVGLDRRPSEEGPTRTDTILLLHIDPDRDRAGILSIPRDALVEVPLPEGGFTVDRINTAFVFGYDPDEEGSAPAMLREAIEHNLGLHANYYAVLDVFGADEIIDAVGGVDLVVEEAFGQEDYSHDDVNVVPQFFPEGKLHLNGYEAVAYGRIREGSSDLERIQRQQQVAEALIAKASSPRSFWRLPMLWHAYRGAVESNLSTWQSVGLLALLKRIGGDDIALRSLGDAAEECTNCNASTLLLDPEETARLVSEAFGDSGAGQQAAQRLLEAGVTP